MENTCPKEQNTNYVHISFTKSLRIAQKCEQQRVYWPWTETHIFFNIHSKKEMDDVCYVRLIVWTVDFHPSHHYLYCQSSAMEGCIDQVQNTSTVVLQATAI